MVLTLCLTDWLRISDLPLKNGRLTPLERAHARHFADSGSMAEAARRAGGHPANAKDVLTRPAVVAEVQRLQMERLNNEALPLAIDTLLACMRAPAAPWAAKNQAAKIALDHTIGRDNGAAAKPDHEMTAQEIQAEIVRLEARRIELERPTIDGEAEQVAGVFD